jgi:hypothetical protein
MVGQAHYVAFDGDLPEVAWLAQRPVSFFASGPLEKCSFWGQVLGRIFCKPGW